VFTTPTQSREKGQRAVGEWRRAIENPEEKRDVRILEENFELMGSRDLAT